MIGLPRKTIIFTAVLLGLLICSSAVFGGSTGKIKGVVTDSESGDPIPGASVLIVGTTQGAMTDPDGYFLITLVPPGEEYVLQVTSVSYNTVEVTGVKVSTDLTTEQNVEMGKAVTDLGKTIKVTANQDRIEKYVISSQVKRTAEDIKTMPIQNVDQLLKSTAGINVTAEGEILIRGGRAGEVAYIVDGVNIGDPLGGAGPMNLGLSLTSGSIQEISIIKDGFDPEYGNALSGIVKITTQTGSAEKTNMSVQYITDDFGNNDLNEYSENYDNVQFILSGPDPILKDKVFPALGLNFLEDRDVTYFFFAEVTKTGTAYDYSEFASETTLPDYSYFNLLGIEVPERQSNDYSINSNILFKPRSNMKAVFSYKTSYSHYMYFDWLYRYSPLTSIVVESDWNVYSMELTHQLSKNMHYYLRASYYERDYKYRPGDPNDPGRGMDPDEFLQYDQFERFTDQEDADGYKNGVYDEPEPLINIYPDTGLYGRDLSGPWFTSDQYGTLISTDNQVGYSYYPDFRFNNGSYGSEMEQEPFIDLNGNGKWDQGDYLYDTNGNGEYDYDRRDVVGEHTPEPYIDGDINLGEDFTDVNNNGVYDEGIDIFIISNGPDNQDVDRNSRYTWPYPYEAWSPGIPFVDRNGNGLYDAPNNLYDPGEQFVDENGNGVYDQGGTTASFLDVDSYYSTTQWHHRNIRRYVLESRVYRQIKNHELKAGMELKKEYITMEDIRSLEQPYTGPDDGGPYPGIGELRDFYDYEPLSGTFYLRDNLEYGSMIASLGFRFDFFIQTTGLEEVAKYDDLGSGIIYGDRNRLSPRIGFSYPISDRAKIHFNYGHFYQLPVYSKMYDRNTSSASASDVVGNYNLDYEKTIQYSFGVKYAISEDYTVDISGYYKDEFDKVNSALVKLGGGALRIQQYQNRDYARARGFEVAIDKRGGRLINGEINYTYAFAYGKTSQSREDYWDEFLLSNESLAEKPIDDDVRHKLNCTVQLAVPETMKPRLFGIRIPSGWSFTVLGEFRTGKPFTPSSGYPGLELPEGVTEADENSLRMPSILNFDIKFEKYFSLVSLNWRFIVWINNLLDNKNVRYVNTSTGRADTSEDNGGTRVTGGTEYDKDPANWERGRQINLGLQVNL